MQSGGAAEMPIAYDGDARRLSPPLPASYPRLHGEDLHAPVSRAAATATLRATDPDSFGVRVRHTRRAGIVQAIATIITENTATVR
jgi:hypothetical protein